MPISVYEYNLTLVVGWITYAEAKATLIATAALTLAGVSLTDVPAATRVIRNAYREAGWWTFGTIILLHVLFYALLTWCLSAAVSVVLPRLTPASGRHSWYFFQSMGKLPPGGYHDFVASQDEETVRQQISDQIYNNCRVAVTKFAGVRRGIFALLLAAGAGVLAVFPVLVLDQLISKAP